MLLLVGASVRGFSSLAPTSFRASRVCFSLKNAHFLSATTSGVVLRLLDKVRNNISHEISGYIRLA